jgi:hypothetical protein
LLFDLIHPSVELIIRKKDALRNSLYLVSEKVSNPGSQPWEAFFPEEGKDILNVLVVRYSSTLRRYFRAVAYSLTNAFSSKSWRGNVGCKYKRSNKAYRGTKPEKMSIPSHTV